MPYRNANYCAFYVDEPFNQNNLGANYMPDFRTYNLLRAWKASDSSFPFIDAHDKNYNVRDNSDWEGTLKPRLRERLRNSKNIILILSTITRNSRALREELDYGINNLGLPVIVIYPDYRMSDIWDESGPKENIKQLWERLPVFRDNINKVPTLHIALDKDLVKNALNDRRYMV